MSRPLSPSEVADALVDLPGFDRGPTGHLNALIELPSFRDAVRLVALVADEAEAMDHHPDLDLRFRHVAVRLTTHSAGGLTQLDVELAHRVAALTRQVGGRVTGPAPAVEIAIDSPDIGRIRDFWRVGLGYVERTDPDGDVHLFDPLGRNPKLWFQPTPEHRRERGRFHLDVYVPDAVAPDRVRAVVAAGGVLVTDEFAPSWWVLADADGNELCVCTRQEVAAPAERPVLDDVVVLPRD